MVSPEMDVITRVFLAGSILTATLGGAGTVDSQGVGQGQCGFDPDCKEPTPFCTITYDIQGNFGVCTAEQKAPPPQVLGEQSCPQGTVRQLIYQNEGSEAVCLPPEVVAKESCPPGQTKEMKEYLGTQAVFCRSEVRGPKVPQTQLRWFPRTRRYIR